MKWLMMLYLTLFTLGGCGGGSDPLPEISNGYVGRLDGSQAYVAIVVADKTIVAYLCDGPNQTAESFWTTVVDARSFRLDTPSGAVLRADIVGDTAAGEITLRDGSRHKFIARASRGEAGLYYTLRDSRLDPELWGGWVIDNDGSQRGALKLRGQFQPTLALTSSGVVMGGTSFAVARIGAAGDRIAATRIAAPTGAVFGREVELAPSPPAPFVPIPYPNLPSRPQPAG